VVVTLERTYYGDKDKEGGYR